MEENRIFVLIGVILQFLYFFYFLLPKKRMGSAEGSGFPYFIAAVTGTAVIWLTQAFILLNFRLLTWKLAFHPWLPVIFLFNVAVLYLFLSASFRPGKRTIHLLRNSLFLGVFLTLVSLGVYTLLFGWTRPDPYMFAVAAVYYVTTLFLTLRLQQQVKLDQRAKRRRISVWFYGYLAFIMGHGVVGSFISLVESYGVAENYDSYIVEFITLFLLVATTVVYAEKQYLFKEQQLQDKNRELHVMAYHDALTGLANRARIRQTIGDWIGKGFSFQVIVIDLDHFKNLNDLLGHEAGDKIIVNAADRLMRLVRDPGMAGRLDGDEFVVIQPYRDEAELIGIIGEMITAISAPVLLAGRQLSVTASIGAASFPDDAESADVLLRNADIALNKAKSKGSGAYHLFSRELDREAVRDLHLTQELKDVVGRNELELFYQPQVDIETRNLAGFEALLRWNHPNLSQISPGKFIPLAEQTGAIVPIGEWVLRQACAQMSQWNRKFGLSMKISVNLSFEQLIKEHFIEMVAEVLEETRLPGGLLELEITEGAAMRDVDHTVKIMEKLHRMGVKISIDDFGTGYSSLSYLKRFHVDRLKIDRSFIRDLSDDTEDQGIVTAILSMAKALQLQTTAEGVEREEQLVFLRMHDCQEAQGFLLSRPLSVTAAEDLLQERRYRLAE